MKRLIAVTGTILLFICTSAHAWTKTQVAHIAAGCTVSPCVVTLSSTGANHLLVVGLLAQTTGTTLGAPPAGACNVSWVHALGAPAGLGGDQTDLYYCLNSVSGVTSFSQPITSISSTVDVIVWEATRTLTNIALDSGAFPSGGVNDGSCTSCVGVSLTLSGNANFITCLSASSGSVNGSTGAGFTYEGTSNFGDGFATGLTSGSRAAPATWTASSGTLIAFATAFQETGNVIPTQVSPIMVP
jgi:hypothetical protein